MTGFIFLIILKSPIYRAFRFLHPFIPLRSLVVNHTQSPRLYCGLLVRCQKIFTNVTDSLLVDEHFPISAHKGEAIYQQPEYQLLWYSTGREVVRVPRYTEMELDWWKSALRNFVHILPTVYIWDSPLDHVLKYIVIWPLDSGWYPEVMPVKFPVLDGNIP